MEVFQEKIESQKSNTELFKTQRQERLANIEAAFKFLEEDIELRIESIKFGLDEIALKLKDQSIKKLQKLKEKISHATTASTSLQQLQIELSSVNKFLAQSIPKHKKIHHKNHIGQLYNQLEIPNSIKSIEHILHLKSDARITECFFSQSTNRILLASDHHDHIYIIDINDGFKFLGKKKFTTSNKEIHVAIDDANNWLFVLQNRSNQIKVYNLTTFDYENDEIQNDSILPKTSGLKYHSNLFYLRVQEDKNTDTTRSAVYEMDRSSGQILRHLQLDDCLRNVKMYINDSHLFISAYYYGENKDILRKIQVFSKSTLAQLGEHDFEKPFIGLIDSISGHLVVNIYNIYYNDGDICDSINIYDVHTKELLRKFILSNHARMLLGTLFFQTDENNLNAIIWSTICSGEIFVKLVRFS